MTKRVRIENADTSDYKVVVEVWDKGYSKDNGDGAVTVTPDTLAFTRELSHPCAMTGDDIYLTSTRYVVVKEA